MHSVKSIAPVRNAIDLTLTHTLIPLKDMSESHLIALLEESTIEVYCPGQQLFSRGSYDGNHYYLLHGEVNLIDEHGKKTVIQGRTSVRPIAQHQPRLVTAVALSDCSVLTISSERLDKLLAWSQVADYLQLNMSRQRDLDEDIDWMMTVLRSNLFFKVPPINVEQIFSRLSPHVVYAGDVIIRQGEIGDRCYFLKEGVAEVWRNTGPDRSLLATIGPGRCFGEDALVNETERNASVIMCKDGVLMSLDKQDFYRLLREPLVNTLELDQLEVLINDGAVAVDARGEEEYGELHLQHAVNIPLHLLGIKSRMLDKKRPYVFYCDTGRRSRAAVHLLTQQGFNVYALNDCVQLFSSLRWQSILDAHSNYVLREGKSVAGS